MPVARRKTKPLTSYDDVPKDVKKIANEMMGRGALESLWNTIVDDSPNGRPAFNILLRVVDGAPIGFALFHYETMSSENFSYTIGIIDAVCVRSSYVGNGYGSILTFNVLRRMSLHGVNRIEAVLKEPSSDSTDLDTGSPTMGSERFLFDLGFKKVAYLEDHWHYPSIDYPYDCIVCHEQPDSCTGVLMAINES